MKRLLLLFLLVVPPAARSGEVVVTVSDPDGVVARVSAPVFAKIDLAKSFGGAVRPGQVRLTDADGAAIPVQFEPDAAGARYGTLWWLLPPGAKGERRFKLTVTGDDAPAALTIKSDAAQKFYDVAEDAAPVLRYNFGTVPLPAGTTTNVARGDYIHPLFGLNGETLTDDYPKDHAHHRGVWWSWPVTRWREEVRDIWAVRGVWARPVAMRRAEAGPVFALLEAENVWKWGDAEPIVREEVVIRAFRCGTTGRCVDVEVRLTALADRVAIGGRPHGGYGGFCLRAAPTKEQKITTHLHPPDGKLCRAWMDYSGIFAGGKGGAGVAIFEHKTNPGYPNPARTYPNLNCMMPAFPCEREVPLSKDKPLILKHRLWIHDGIADEKALADAWAAYATPPAVAVLK